MTVGKLLYASFLLCGISLCAGARILAIFPFEIKSHRGVLEPIIEELAAKGHQIDVISTFILKSANCTNIITIPVSDNLSKIKYSNIYSPSNDYACLANINSEVCDLLGHPVISKLIKDPPKNPPYDLLMVHILSGYQCMSAIGIALNIPIIGIVTTMLYPQMSHYINDPQNLATMSKHYYSYEDNLNFWNRVYNVIMSHYYISHHYKQADDQDYYIKKYLGPNMPSYREIEKSYSFIFSNSYYVYHGVVPKVPALIEIGGINVKNDSSQMDPKLKKLLDDSNDGFVYFSFGSMVVIESLSQDILQKFYSAIRKMSPIRVILKSGDPPVFPKNLPSNVFTFPWFPQQKVLEHPNIKAFVTHGGGLGTQEAIYYKVPMICVPFFAEQHVNCDISGTKNISLKLDIPTAEQKDYDYVFDQILKNPFYKDAINKFSSLYWDRPQLPRQAVTYWTEYILRHGKSVLQTKGLELKWWQLELLDVYTFIIVNILALVIVGFFIFYQIYRYLLQKWRRMINVKLDKKFK